MREANIRKAEELAKNIDGKFNLTVIITILIFFISTKCKFVIFLSYLHYKIRISNITN